jgi:isochorismate synthase
VISVPAPKRPAAAALSILRRIDDSTAVAWLPGHGVRLAGVGAAATLSGSVSSRALRRDADALLASTTVVAHDDLPGVEPRLLGGFAFSPRSALDTPWERFGPGRLILPRWTYGQDSARAWLSVAVQGPLSGGARDGALSELDTLKAGLEHWVGAKPEHRQKRGENSVAADAADADDVLRAEWSGRVEAILGELQAGRVGKVVAARTARLALEEPSLDPSLVLRELVSRFRRCTSFYLEVNGEAFVGATPERLLSLKGREVATEALAGSAPPGKAERLLESAKDRREHGLVADEIAIRLQPLCEDIRLEEIRPLELPNIVHLRTSIRARARKGTRLLDLVAALHPTPAVGGLPREIAVRWIEENEPVGRGWYSGPFGWLDASGDGEFVVALRSGLIGKGRALMYAGAGLVRASDPEAEWEETEAKMSALRDAVRATFASEGAIPA